MVERPVEDNFDLEEREVIMPGATDSTIIRVALENIDVLYPEESPIAHDLLWKARRDLTKIPLGERKRKMTDNEASEVLHAIGKLLVRVGSIPTDEDRLRWQSAQLNIKTQQIKFLG